MATARVPRVNMVYRRRERMTPASSLDRRAFGDVKLKRDTGQRAACLLSFEKDAQVGRRNALLRSRCPVLLVLSQFHIFLAESG